MNNLMPGVLKFEVEYVRFSIDFLDIKLSYNKSTQKIETDLHIKPTNAQLFLDWFSNHPYHCKKGIIYSQALRIIMICSEPERVEYQLNQLKQKFIQVNYPEDVVREQFLRASQIQRADLLLRVNSSRKKKKSKSHAHLIFTHNSGNPPLRQWFNDLRYILDQDPKTKKIAETIKIVSRQTKNAQQLATQAKLKPLDQAPRLEEGAGSHKCKRSNQRGCHMCPKIKETNKFTSSNTKRTYKIRKNSFVIYLGQCKLCQGQYVGKSKRELRERHSGHKQDIKNNKGGLGHHYHASDG